MVSRVEGGRAMEFFVDVVSEQGRNGPSKGTLRDDSQFTLTSDVASADGGSEAGPGGAMQ
jgi:hypothetical protein